MKAELELFYSQTGYLCIKEENRIMIPFATMKSASSCRYDIEFEYPEFTLTIEDDPDGFNVIVTF